ncbi:MAG: glucosamine-6-phosphate deaminase [Candidatus Obscuribacterales bacterium]|nr:glucosamine-6-phosphate deaminase [Candidatus Obscuribacterales bacterium]
MDPYQSLSQQLAERIIQTVQAKPDAVIGMPTGRTPMRCYELLSQRSGQKKLDWSSVRCFGLDEYVDTDEVHSFRHFLEQNLYTNGNFTRSNLFNPLDVDDYDGLIAAFGGLDLTVLGLGQNGHIAFNEPGTPFLSWTHTAQLTDSTRHSNLEFFGSLDKVPTNSVTMGIQTILASKRIILVVAGKNKVSVLQNALKGPICAELPASYLQLHPCLEVMSEFPW